MEGGDLAFVVSRDVEEREKKRRKAEGRLFIRFFLGPQNSSPTGCVCLSPTA